jgi:putative hydrolase of the HAD superfamily
VPQTKDFPFSAILFDVDDTLFERRSIFNAWAKRYIREMLAVIAESESQEIIRRVTEIEGPGYGSKKELIEATIQLYPPPAGSMYSADTAYAEFLDANVLSDQALELLNYLEALQFPFGIVTNGGPRQVEKVEKLGLTLRTQCMFVSVTFGSAKPDPDIFLAAAKCIGCQPNEILFVGDHPVNDIQGAKNAGMNTAWLHNNQPWPPELRSIKPDLTINQLSDLLVLLHRYHPA